MTRVARSSAPNLFFASINEWQHNIVCRHFDTCNVQDINGKPRWDCEFIFKVVR